MTANRCGTTAGYRAHQTAGTPTCIPCRRAQAEWQRNYEKRRYLAGGQYDEARRQLSGGHLLIDDTGTRRRLQALGVMGWPANVLSERLGMARSYVADLRFKPRDRVQRRTAEKIAALYDELSMVLGPSAVATAAALRKGWAPPLAWDDETIDDPAARPMHDLRGTPGRQRDEDRDEKVLELTRAGLSATEISMRLRITNRSVQRVRAKFRAEDVA